MNVHAWSNASSASPGAGVPRIAIRIATPSAEPIWRDIVEHRDPGREPLRRE